ncbi:J domain-containing protein [Sphingomonas sp. ASV193]|uniref:J domain-containing protein n=1 Tax=Sphingomonas sp. ASV193 TaxID=3144405 RepID=UPI0032E85774
MPGGQDFVDYYAVLGVTPYCDAKTLEAAFHRLAKNTHPDHSGNDDIDAFSAATTAYRILRDPERRAAYDERFFNGQIPPSPEYTAGDDHDSQVADAIRDADDQARILMALYRKRREAAQDAGVVPYYLQKLLGCSDEHFEFHKWYLKEKGLIVGTEQGTIAITIAGVDHVIAMSRGERAEQLRLGAREKD